jgi:glycosyltransferase involved in cell wall biosynthesis
MDNNSDDGSIDIIRSYADKLAYWESQPDRGQAHAINKGLKRATGEWVCWQNSDDIFYPSAFSRVVSVIQKQPEADFIVGDINVIDENDMLIRPMCYVKPTYKSLLAERMVLTNQAAFWKRKMHDEIGWLDEKFYYGFDYEWFLRILKHTDKSCHMPNFLGALRYHPNTKTSLNQTGFQKEYAQIMHGRSLPKWIKNVYRIRRLALTLASGRLRYVYNGVTDRCYSALR